MDCTAYKDFGGTVGFRRKESQRPDEVQNQGLLCGCEANVVLDHGTRFVGGFARVGAVCTYGMIEIDIDAIVHKKRIAALLPIEVRCGTNLVPPDPALLRHRLRPKECESQSQNKGHM